jgi:hypothetical protein
MAVIGALLVTPVLLTGLLLAAIYRAFRWLLDFAARKRDITRWRAQWANANASRATATTVFEDPALPPDRLTTLAARALAEDWTLPTADRRAAPLITAIAAHPNTPPATLIELLNRRPHDAYPGFIRNPVLPLLPLENPDFVHRLSGATIRFLLLQRDLPSTLARLLSTHPDPITAFEARTHIALLADSETNSVEGPRERIAEFDQIIRAAVQMVHPRDRCLYGTMAILGLAPPWCTPRQEPIYDPLLWEEIPPVPDEVRDALRREIHCLENGKLPKAVHTWCAEPPQAKSFPLSLDPFRRKAVLRAALLDPATPPNILTALHCDNHPLYPLLNETWWVRDYMVIRHPNVPPDLLAREQKGLKRYLLTDEFARYLLLTHCSRAVYHIPAEDLAQYCETGDLPTRLALARTLTRWHPLHIVLRWRLTRDPNALVRAAARREI